MTEPRQTEQFQTISRMVMLRHRIIQLQAMMRHAGRVLGAIGDGRLRPGGLKLLSLLFGVRPILGTFYETRGASEQLEDELDVIYVRENRENFWAPSFGPSEDLAGLRISGEVAIVGKGPDLDRMQPEDLGKFAAVFCINESVHAIEKLEITAPVFSVQADSILGDACKPRRGRLIVALCSAHNYRSTEDKYVFRLNDYDIERVCTAGYAIAIARRAGACAFTLFAFNAVTDGNPEYAAAIGGRPADTQQWHRHKGVIEDAADGAPLEWKSLAEVRIPE